MKQNFSIRLTVQRLQIFRSQRLNCWSYQKILLHRPQLNLDFRSRRSKIEPKIAKMTNRVQIVCLCKFPQKPPLRIYSMRANVLIVLLQRPFSRPAKGNKMSAISVKFKLHTHLFLQVGGTTAKIRSEFFSLDFDHLAMKHGLARLYSC